MPGLPDLSRDLARRYNITVRDAREVIQFVNEDMVQRLKRGEDLHIDLFGSFKVSDGLVRFNPSKYMCEELGVSQNVYFSRYFDEKIDGVKREQGDS